MIQGAEAIGRKSKERRSPTSQPWLAFRLSESFGLVMERREDDSAFLRLLDVSRGAFLVGHCGLKLLLYLDGFAFCLIFVHRFRLSYFELHRFCFRWGTCENGGFPVGLPGGFSYKTNKKGVITNSKQRHTHLGLPVTSKVKQQGLECDFKVMTKGIPGVDGVSLISDLFDSPFWSRFGHDMLVPWLWVSKRGDA